MKTVLKKFSDKLGYEICKKQQVTPLDISQQANCHITHLELLVQKASFIPTMLTVETAKFLYSLCYMQQMQGDVVEVGSWQGYSTALLATAVKESGNGKCYAIDHFQGNVGKESSYVVGEDDLSDLKANFERNMRALNLNDHIELFDMDSKDAANKLQNNTIRFLFIDGDHTEVGVKQDIALFFPLLQKGSIVVFDDFAPNFPGVINAVTELAQSGEFSRKFAYNNTFVLQV